MSIAQPDVAGEGDAYPEAPALEPGNNESEPLSCDARNLPYQTLRAHQRALSVAGLPQRARCALAALAQTVDRRKPLASIFAHRDYLAARAGLSERTWYRAERDLAESGMITIAEQTRKTRHARFGAAYIYLTEAAAILLGLLGPEAQLGQRAPKASSQTARSGAAPTTSHSQGASPADCTTPDQAQSAKADGTYSQASPSANLADPYTNVYRLPASSQKRQQARLPSDVQPLLSLGFHENYIFKLMKLARVDHQKRLGDVVEACWDSLKKAKRPIPYLRTLLRSSTDFAWLASQRRTAQLVADTLAQAQTTLEEARREIAGGAFVSRGGNVLYRISDDGQVLTSRDVRESRERVATTGWLPGFLQAIRDGLVKQSLAEATACIPGQAERGGPLAPSASPGAAVSAASSTSLTSISLMRAQLRAIKAGFGGSRPTVVEPL
ncbi:replication protein O [Burkholderia gladioli]|uniref:replication protein O n=1 Tax=Burkholderia gladioli TaxID=28095 RepID=UPI000BBD135E|nr:replication protein O [Burkholderia gladioli]ATF90481.1 replication protein O [Burkholderia gladioli pv. gladioli]MBJ9711275.1 replication protein O [Burkholderia gladioli]MDN7499550.1 replication protein O [Burkholderia gladioli]MDR8086189.1 replication protein O [Burkholderia gladioli]MDZ4041490.1 replication protein O [Burkholderia gladioli pv. alliicola]